MPEITYLEAIRQALWQEMKCDERVFLLGEDIGRYGGAFGLTHGMLDEFGPERVRETPISEATIVATAIGASLLGMRRGALLRLQTQDAGAQELSALSRASAAAG